VLRSALKTHAKFATAHAGALGLPFLASPAHHSVILYLPVASAVLYPFCGALAAIGGIAGTVENKSELQRDRIAKKIAEIVALRFRELLVKGHESIDPSGVQRNLSQMQEYLENQDTAEQILLEVQIALTSEQLPVAWESFAREGLQYLENIQTVQSVASELLATLHAILREIAKQETNWTEIPASKLEKVLFEKVAEKSDPLIVSSVRYAKIARRVSASLLLFVYLVHAIIPIAIYFWQ
jgi:hypothetical protein